MTHITVSPAYGRDYTNRKAVVADWNDNKDFVVESFGPDMGRYINKADADRAGIARVEIRYAKMRKVVMV